MMTIHPKLPVLMRRKANPTGRDADPRRTIPLNTAAWQKLRARVLAASPICHDCLVRGRLTKATDVDHDDGDPSNNDWGNLVARCHSCHSAKTMRERHGKKTVTGCDVSGMPTDPDHPWNQKSRATDCSRPDAKSFLNAKSTHEDHDSPPSL